jgi:transcriptional regulator with XRE-family HTH domain
MSMARPVGDLLREWRQRRRLSQLDFACLADISTRYLSFLETGRSQPSREMLLHLAIESSFPADAATADALRAAAATRGSNPARAAEARMSTTTLSSKT